MQAVPPILPPPPLSDGTEGGPRSADRHANLVRFQAELEFVQCLANPMYLAELSAQGYMDKPEFINYLRYLEYWRDPAYVQFITYPTCLAYLTLLQEPLFRDRLKDPLFAPELVRIGTRHHETWRTEGMKEPATTTTADIKSDTSVKPSNEWTPLWLWPNTVHQIIPRLRVRISKPHSPPPSPPRAAQAA